MKSYYLGLDLGQSKDYTALAIVECVFQPERPLKPDWHGRHLQRYQLGTSYPAIVASVAEMLKRDAFKPEAPVLAIDGTGVGAPVVDMFTEAGLRAQLRPIIITGGDQVTKDGNITRVPKRELVGTVQVALQTGRLKIAPALKDARLLQTELENFQVKITDTAHDTYGAWREGTHDDLVLAIALALWVADIPPYRPPAVGGGRSNAVMNFRRGILGPY